MLMTLGKLSARLYSKIKTDVHVRHTSMPAAAVAAEVDRPRLAIIFNPAKVSRFAFKCYGNPVARPLLWWQCGFVWPIYIYSR